VRREERPARMRFLVRPHAEWTRKGGRKGEDHTGGPAI